PDVVADFSDAEVAEVGSNRVRLSGVRGHPRTPTLKANVFFDGGWLGEGEISYAGAGAETRARLAMDVMSKRVGRDLQLRFDLIGVMSVLGDDTDRLLNATRQGAATDVRLRVAAKHEDATQIDRMLRELTALWTGGPAGGGGVRVTKRQRLSQKSCLVPRERVPASHAFV
ncbi:MAG: acyclic terpene utilization AtuA family protein, partial [Burkholderiaceae bacterium]|nr:acyclic terpene utilization AtuA family protein [Burkholderiaceae bacterium]